MSDSENKVAAFAVCIGAFFLGTYVDVQLWSWFVVPVFAAPALAFWQAAGLSLTLKSYCSTRAGKSSEPLTLETAFVSLAVVLLIWGIGALIHLGAMP